MSEVKTATPAKVADMTIEQIYGDKAGVVRQGVNDGNLRITVATVTISADKARSTDDVKINYERVDIVNDAGSLVLYGSPEKAFDDLTYAFDLGIRSNIRTGYLSKVADPDKELRKAAELMVKAGLYADVETGLAELKARKAALTAA